MCCLIPLILQISSCICGKNPYIKHCELTPPKCPGNRWILGAAKESLVIRDQERRGGESCWNHPRGRKLPSGDPGGGSHRNWPPLAPFNTQPRPLLLPPRERILSA